MLFKIHNLHYLATCIGNLVIDKFYRSKAWGNYVHITVASYCSTEDVCICIVIQVTPLQETATGIQGSYQHQTTANDAASEQQSSGQHQPTPQYALLNYKPKDKEVSMFM